jgi:hypothetical protein
MLGNTGKPHNMIAKIGGQLWSICSIWTGAISFMLGIPMIHWRLRRRDEQRR